MLRSACTGATAVSRLTTGGICKEAVPCPQKINFPLELLCSGTFKVALSQVLNFCISLTKALAPRISTPLSQLVDVLRDPPWS